MGEQEQVKASVEEMAAKPVDGRKFLDEHPAFALVVTRFMALYDAAEVLEQLGHVPTAGYVRAVGEGVLKEAGIDEPFMRAMIASRPPFGGK